MKQRHSMMKRRDFLKTLGAGIALNMMPLSQAEEDRRVQRPNILFALADDWSYGHASAYGCCWINTPSFDRVAGEGLLFTQAFTPTAKCAPSRAALLTGRNPWQLKAAANHVAYFPIEFKTYAEALAEQGYAVGMTAKGWAPGLANDASGKPRLMTGVSFGQRKLDPPATGIHENDYAANFTDFIKATPEGQPWCFWYGSNEPHRGYEYGSGVAKAGKKTSDIDRVPACWPDNETVRNDMLDYAMEVEHFDTHLGRMLALLEKRGMLDNALVLVTGDNGMPFPHDKGNTYHDGHHVPLAVMWKNGIKHTGRVLNDYVSFIDVAPTFLEAAGVEWSRTGMAPATGRSLLDLFQAEKAGFVTPGRDHVLVGRERNDVGRPHDQGYPVRGIVKDDMLYVHNFEPSRWPGCNPETGYLDTDGGPTKTELLKTRKDPQQKKYWELCFGKRPAEELYDLKQDPDCVNNLAGNNDLVALKEKMKEQLFAELRAQEDPRMLGQGHLFDEYPTADDATRDFYQRRMRGEKVDAGWVNPTDFQSSSQ